MIYTILIIKNLFQKNKINKHKINLISSRTSNLNINCENKKKIIK